MPDSENEAGQGRARDEGPEDRSGEDQAGSTLRVIVDQVVTLAIAIAIALAIRHVLVEPFGETSSSSRSDARATGRDARASSRWTDRRPGPPARIS